MTYVRNKRQVIGQVPEGWRRVRGIQLQIFQINALIDQAEEDEGEFPVLFGKYRAEFEATHEIKDGQWVPVEVH